MTELTIMISSDLQITVLKMSGKYEDGKQEISDLFDFLEAEGVDLTDASEVESHVPDDQTHNLLHQINGEHSHSH